MKRSIEYISENEGLRIEMPLAMGVEAMTMLYEEAFKGYGTSIINHICELGGKIDYEGDECRVIKLKDLRDLILKLE